MLYVMCMSQILLVYSGDNKYPPPTEDGAKKPEAQHSPQHQISLLNLTINLPFGLTLDYEPFGVVLYSCSFVPGDEQLGGYCCTDAVKQV